MRRFHSFLISGKPAFLLAAFVALTQLVLLLKAVSGVEVGVMLLLIYMAIMLVQCIAAFWPVLGNALAPVNIVHGTKQNARYRLSIRVIALLLPVAFLLANPVLVAIFASVAIVAAVVSGLIVRARGKSARSSYIDLQPAVVVYIDGEDALGYQVNQWIPVLEKLPVKSVIVSRNVIGLESVFQSSIPRYFAKGIRDVEWVMKRGPQKVLYPANPNANIHALRHSALQHLFINHGESDKVVNQNKIMMAYDKLLVGGAIAEERLRSAGLSLRENQVVYVGRPQAEMFLQKNLSKSSQIKTVLYAPTWEGYVADAEYSSISGFGMRIVEELLAAPAIDVIFKPHPFTGKSKKIYKESLDQIIKRCHEHGAKVLDDQSSLYDAMNESDLLVTDISSVLNDYLVTNKPMVLCNVAAMAETALHDAFPSSKAAYLIEQDESIIKLVDDISKSDPKSDVRLETRTRSLGDPAQSAYERFAAAVLDGIDNGA